MPPKTSAPGAKQTSKASAASPAKTAKPRAKAAAPAAKAQPTRAASARSDGKRAGAAASGRFEGFADLSFFAELAREQSREWFKANQARFEQGFAEPMRQLLAEIRAKLDAAYPDCDIAEPKVFRLHRDVRFSADKSPYKTYCSGILAVKKGAGKVTETPAALYFHLGVDAKSFEPEIIAAAGLYMMDSTQLARFRAAVLEDARGAEVAKLVAGLERRGMEMMAGESLKTAPRGVDPAHPRIELLKRKGLIAGLPRLTPRELRSRAFVDRLVADAKAAAALVRWLAFNT